MQNKTNIRMRKAVSTSMKLNINWLILLYLNLFTSVIVLWFALFQFPVTIFSILTFHTSALFVKSCFLLLLSKDLSLTNFHSRSLSSLRMPYVCLFKFISMLVLTLWIAFIDRYLFISVSSLKKYNYQY